MREYQQTRVKVFNACLAKERCMIANGCYPTSFEDVSLHIDFLRKELTTIEGEDLPVEDM